MDTERRFFWSALNKAFWDNLRLLRVVRERFSSPDEIFRTAASELRGLGLDAPRIERLGSSEFLTDAHKEFDTLGKKGYSLVTFEDSEYPLYLKEIFDPPCVLYCRGHAEAMQGPAVAVVGTRRPSSYGKAVAGQLAEDLASRGIVIVSGLAVGIDSAAHAGALEGGRTVAVLGSGLNELYPRENRKLADRIAESGAVVSEFPPATEPFAQNFPRRNRVISGLSLAVVVVEAAKKSGSLITAGFGLDQDREVMAVPGNVTSDLSRGTNWLIRHGAKLVRGWEDVAEELPPPVRETLLAEREGATRPLPLLTDGEDVVYKLLSPDAATPVDDLVERCGLSVTEVLTVLLNLEIKGLVTVRPGSSYQRRM
jgi:DNA processing protein